MRDWTGKFQVFSTDVIDHASLQSNPNREWALTLLHLRPRRFSTNSMIYSSMTSLKDCVGSEFEVPEIPHRAILPKERDRASNVHVQ